MDALNHLAEEYEQAKVDPEFQARLDDLLKDYVGRPSPLYLAERLTAFAGGAQIYLKREDLNHTGAHKINNAIGQVMLARRMGKTRVIAETGAGQHGVATATACALFGLECTVYMGEEDIRRQKLNVFNMRTMGAKVVPVTTGSRTLRDATNEAMRDWMGSSKETHYTIGSVVGPHPFPDDRSRLPGGDRPRDAAAIPGAAEPAAGPGGRLRRGRVERGGNVLSVPRGRRGRAGRRRGRRPGAEARRACLEPDPGPAGRAPRQLQLRAPGRGRPDPERALDLRRARLSGRRARSTATGRTRVGSGTRTSPTRKRSTPTTRPPASRASCPPSNRATPWPRPSRRPAASVPASSLSSACPAVATRTPMRSPGSEGSRSERVASCQLAVASENTNIPRCPGLSLALRQRCPAQALHKHRFVPYPWQLTTDH